MKHINNYKLYESVESEKAFTKMIDNIDDMLYEIRDYGFECEIVDGFIRAGVGFAGKASIIIINKGRFFSLKEIEDCLIRILEYSYNNDCRVTYCVNLIVFSETNNKVINYDGEYTLKYLSYDKYNYDFTSFVGVNIYQNVDPNN